MADIEEVIRTLRDDDPGRATEGGRFEKFVKTALESQPGILGQEQLEAEIEAGGWAVVDADGLDLLTPDTAALWPTAVRRAGMESGIRTGAAPSVERN